MPERGHDDTDAEDPIEGPDPPPELRERVLTRVRAEPQTRPRVVTPRSWVVISFAIAAVVILILTGAPADNASATKLDALDKVAPNAEEIRLVGADGILAVGAAGRAVLVVRRLEPAPVGRTYQAWVLHARRAIRAGTFVGGGEQTVHVVTSSVRRGTVVVVSIETAAGSRRPHPPIVLAAALAP